MREHAATVVHLRRKPPEPVWEYEDEVLEKERKAAELGRNVRHFMLSLDLAVIELLLLGIGGLLLAIWLSLPVLALVR